MYRIQVWSEVKRAYFDVHVVSDHLGAVGFQPASAESPATDIEDGVQALRTCEEVGSAADVICCACDLDTGKRYFDESALPD